MRRSRLDAAERARRDEVRRATWRRFPRCVLADHEPAGRCFGPITPHHLHKSGQGGPYSEANLVGACSHHNDGWIENQPDDAHAVGLVVRYGESIADAWSRMLDANLITVEQMPDDLPTEIRR